MTSPRLLPLFPAHPCRQFLDDVPPPQPAPALGASLAAAPSPAAALLGELGALRAGASHLVVLMFASSALAMCQLALCRPMRLG